MLWAALFFPQLAIDMAQLTPGTGNCEAQSPNSPPAEPLAIILQEGSRRLLMSCNDSARELGLKPGQTLNSAYAIVPDLYTLDYDEKQQQEYLEHLALWGMQYSSWVTPYRPDTILVEIAASLTLFNGLDNLVERISNDAVAQGLHLQIGIAPTPAAARLLARLAHAGQQTPVKTILEKSHLHDSLSPVQVDFLPLDEFTLKGLRQSGIKHCRQLFALPANALTRRFGKASTDLVYKLLGTLPEPCPAFKAPKRFTRGLDLLLEAPDSNALQFPLNRLLNALCGFLRSSDLGVKKLHIVLNHNRIPATRITLGFLEATADHKHLLKTATERLSGTTMAEPATSISIDAAILDDVTRSGKDLFNKSQSQSASIEQAFDILSARLGPERVFTTAVREDHRPEKAPEKSRQKKPHKTATIPTRVSSAMIASDSKRILGTCPARPLWLLQQPRRARAGLTLQSSAERIENGWWCDNDVRRDYYLAQDQQGTWYWVYVLRQTPHQARNRNGQEQQELYIHGLFA